jgi:hypothetical protein
MQTRRTDFTALPLDWRCGMIFPGSSLPAHIMNGEAQRRKVACWGSASVGGMLARPLILPNVADCAKNFHRQGGGK